MAGKQFVLAISHRQSTLNRNHMKSEIVKLYKLCTANVLRCTFKTFIMYIGTGHNGLRAESVVELLQIEWKTFRKIEARRIIVLAFSTLKFSNKSAA